MMKDLKTKPCFGCGYCCLLAPCAASTRIYPGAKICPALQWNGKRHVCDLMNLPGELGRLYRQELYAGEGCCSSLNSWRKEIKNRLEDVISPVVLDKHLQIFLNCLGRQFMGMDGVYLAIMQFSEVLIAEGMDEEKAQKIGTLMKHYLKGNRRAGMTEFFGD